MGQENFLESRNIKVSEKKSKSVAKRYVRRPEAVKGVVVDRPRGLLTPVYEAVFAVGLLAPLNL